MMVQVVAEAYAVCPYPALVLRGGGGKPGVLKPPL